MELLSGYRVLDLADDRGYFCGRVLGDLGADVIKVEPPGGDRGRRRGPFYGFPHPERSLYFMFYNANKRGITLDITKEDGREILKELIKRADVVVESFDVGFLERLGLSYEELLKVNPRLIMTSITPFGEGVELKGGDGVLWAMGGMMYLSGDPDRAPVRVSFPQSYLHASAYGALGTVIALFWREMGGEGQHVVVSAEACVAATLMNGAIFWDILGKNLKRAGQFRTGLSTSANQRLIWRCKDGEVNFPLFSGTTGARVSKTLVKWMDEVGLGDEYMRKKDWDSFDMAEASQEEFDRIERALSKFFGEFRMKELFEGAVSREIWLYPVSTPKEIFEDDQLRARGFWEKVYHDELGEELTYPGSFAKLSGESLKIRRRAPLIGEHNREIYCGELGLSEEELEMLKEVGVI